MELVAPENLPLLVSTTPFIDQKILERLGARGVDGKRSTAAGVGSLAKRCGQQQAGGAITVLEMDVMRKLL